MWKQTSAILLGLIFLLSAAGTAFASGFAIIEQSVSGLGNAFAGGSASAEDATTVFFNPAGMTRLKQNEAIAAVHVIIPSAEFSDKGSSPAVTGLGLGTDEGGDAGELAVVPNMYLVMPIDDKLTFGLGVNAPFGLVTEYNDTWIGRYHAVKSDLKTINVNPSFAVKINDKLSFGLGANFMNVDVELSQMIDFGLVGAINSIPGSIPQGQDGKVVLNADNWAYGWNAGLLYEFNQDTRVGFHYRSKTFVEVEGSAKFSNVPAALSGSFFNTGVSGKITLPASASLSVFHNATDKLALMADATWTQWSTFRELTFDFEDPAVADSTTPEEWDDIWRLSVGASYAYNDKLVLRGGLAFDESPIGDNYRTPRIPGDDRYWTSVGCGYKFTEALSMDAAYTHLFVDDAKVNLTSADNASKGFLVGEYENHVDIASVQISYKF